MKGDTVVTESAVAEYLTRAQTAEYLNLSERYVDYLKARGELPYYHVSRRKVLFKREDLDEFMSRLRVSPRSCRDV